MQFQKFLYPGLALGTLAVAYVNYKWTGVALIASGLITWALLHFSRMMQVLKRAADRPIGSVASAVMLNAKLQPKVTLLHVVAMTKSLGAQQSPKNTQPEVYRWTDGSKSHVTCTFLSGKLQTWQLFRPEQPVEDEKTPSAA